MGQQGKKDNSRTHHFQREERERRQIDAEARQNYYNTLTPQQKLELCKKRPGISKREVARITAQLGEVQ